VFVELGGRKVAKSGPGLPPKGGTFVGSQGCFRSIGGEGNQTGTKRERKGLGRKHRSSFWKGSQASVKEVDFCKKGVQEGGEKEAGKWVKCKDGAHKGKKCKNQQDDSFFRWVIGSSRQGWGGKSFAISFEAKRRSKRLIIPVRKGALHSCAIGQRDQPNVGGMAKKMQRI